MTKLKRGNVFAHAKASGKKITFNKPAAKKAVTRAKKPAVKKTVRAVARKRATAPKKQFKYSLKVRKTATGLWSALMGANNLENLKSIARMYARKYPRFAFMVE